MSYGARVVYVFFLLLVLSPVLPLLVGWRRFLSESVTARHRTVLIVMSVLTTSWTFLFASLFSKGLLGPNYSAQRYGIIWTNWIIVLISIVLLATIKEDRAKIPLLFSASLLLAIWSINAALSSVV